MRLILVRHGETSYNAQRRFTGQSDIQLDGIGLLQADALGVSLSSECLDVVAASDLQRARLTAEVIARYHSLPVRQDCNLRELALGEWEGLTRAEVALRDAALLARWQEDPVNCAPPGGETVARLRERVALALRDWRDRYPAASVLWATHGGLIGVLLCHILGLDLRRRWQFRHDNASISEILLSGDRATIVRLNETAHLRNLPC
jgi:broad specificity phosphatase PhoE